MADEELGSGSIVIRLDDTSAVGDAERLGDRIGRILDRASRDAGLRMQRNINRAIRQISPVRVRVEADLRAFGHSIDTLQNFDPIPLPVSPDIDRARFEAAIQAVLAGLEVSVRVVPDLDGFDAAIRAHRAPDLNVNVDVDRGLSRLSGALSGIGSAVGGALGAVARLGTTFAAAGAGVAVLGAALAPALGAVVALPAVALGAAAAVGALKLALSGVGDAFGAALTGSAEQFSKALEKLSPAAQSAALEVRALKPAFDALKTSVQNAFFAPLEGQITGVAAALGGPLKSGLTSIAGNFGLAAERVANFLKSAAGVGAVTGILKGTDQATKGLAAAIGPVVAGFVKLAGSVSAAFGASLGSGIANAGAQLGNFLSTLADSGAAVDLIKGAGAVFSQLGAIASNVGSVLASVFSAAGGAAGPLLGIIAAVTERLAAFFDSAVGSQLLVSVFDTLRTVMAAVGPILDSLFATFASLAPVVSSALGAVAPLFTVLGGAVTELLGAVGPLVTQLASALVPALSALVSAITPVITALVGAFLPVLGPIVTAVQGLVTAFTPLLGIIGTTLAQVIGALAPLLGTVAGLFAQVATALAPLITQITAALVPAFAMLVPVFAQLAANLAPVISAIVAGLLPVLPPLVDGVLAIFNALLPVIPPLLSLSTALSGLSLQLINAAAPVLAFVAGMSKWTVLNFTVPLIEGIIGALTWFVEHLVEDIAQVSAFVTSVVSFFSNLKTNVTALVTGMVSSVLTWFLNMRSTVTGTVSSLVSAVTGFFQSLPGRALSAVSSIVGFMSSVFTSARDAVVTRATALVADTVALVRSLPGKAASALSGIGSVLVSAGADMMRGFINGIQSLAGEIASAALGPVKSAVDGVKGFLGISSPSKLLAQIGRFTGQGFIRGLAGTESGIKAAAEKLVASIRDAFKGQRTGLDDALIRQVQSTEKQLLTLAKRREAIGERIRKANEFAASTAQAALQTGALQGIDAGNDGVLGITFGVEQAAARIRKFTRQVADLAKRGLRSDLLSQVIGLGPDQGAELAKTLSSATTAQLKDLNDAQKQLAAASKSLGRTSADALFDAGEQASKGFLAGLRSQQKDIQDLMLTIARAMAKSIRNALGIKSPSTVFAAIGRNTMDGLGLGIEQRVRHVQRSVIGAASAITDPFGAGATAPSFGAAGAPQLGGGFGRFGGGSAVGQTTNNSRTINNTFHVTEVGDAEATAQRILNRLATSGAGL